jgi:serine/threonine-protein kinase
MSEALAQISAAGASRAVGFSSNGDDLGTPPLPRVFGRLLLLKLLARGGMGDVYLAATTGIEGAERACVVKTVRRDHVHDGSFLARFLDEARVQAQLNHPGVAQVLEAATDENGEPFTVVEYVEGRSLADLRHRSIQLGVRVTWADAVAIAVEMAQALHHVHERAGASGSPLGIVHRDLSPQNVMIGYAGEVKLIDFGTARGQNRRCHTVAGVVFAKPGYVAPEVARQEVGDGRIDIYALGIMLWEMCKSGRFLAGDPQKHLEACAQGTSVVPPIAAMCGAPAALDDVIAKLTANEPGARYVSGAVAATDLARLLSEAPVGRGGERSVRGRVSALMRQLWPREPSSSRAEFARLLVDARKLVREAATPESGRAAELAMLHSDDPAVLPGTPYRLGQKIGEGASGTVYEAEHVELGRKVALKILSPAHATAKDAIDRFRAEARAVAHLSHKNLVALHDFGRSLDGRVFLAMERLTGETLENRLIRLGEIDWREAVSIGIEVCRALEVAHHAGLVHRDLKPANLFATEDGTIKLLDFGVATALTDVPTGEKDPRQKGFAIFGTPEYMAPEQVSGEAVDGRCDIYALGAVLFELVTGTPVFEGQSAVVVMGKQLRERPESARLRAPRRAIPAALDRVILQALSKAPSDRFASAASMSEALAEVLARPDKRRARARQWTTALGVMGAMAIAFGLWGQRERIAARLAPAQTIRGAQGFTSTDPGARASAPLPSTATPLAAPISPSLPEGTEGGPARTGSASLPPLPRSSESTPVAVAAAHPPALEGAHLPDGHGNRPDLGHPKKLRARLPGLETVSHREPKRPPDKVDN